MAAESSHAAFQEYPSISNRMVDLSKYLEDSPDVRFIIRTPSVSFLRNLGFSMTHSVFYHIIFTLSQKLDLWVATPKIHGSNFSVWVCPDGSLAFGRRSALLGANEGFHNYQEVMARLNIQEVARRAVELRPKQTVVFFGEIYGARDVT